MNARAAMVGIGYHFWIRSRWVLLGILIAIVAMAAAAHVPHWPVLRMFVVVAGLFLIGAAVVYLVGVLTFSGDLSTTESGFPRHLMVLPVANRGLALVPILYGAVCLAALWAILARCVLAPMGWAVPILPPLLALAATVAWLQATSWTPFWLPFARVAAAIGSLSTIIAFTIAAQGLEFGEPILIGGLLAATFAAAFAAVNGVARARRGDGTVAPWIGRRATIGARARKRRPFASAERAQIWLELRRNCPMLPGMVLWTTLLLALSPLFARGGPSPFYAAGRLIPGQFILLAFFLLSPVAFTSLLAANLGKFDAWSKRLTIPSFLAARPIADTVPIAAKLKATALSVAIIWAIQLAVLTIECLLPHSFGQSESFAHLLARHATPHRVALAAALIGALIVVTWLNVIKTFVFSLYGRAWLVNTAGFGTLGAYVLLGCLGYWASQHPGSRAAMLHGLPFALLMLVAAKVATAALVVCASRQHRVATNAQLIAWTTAWLLAAMGILSLVCWLVPATRHSMPLLAAGVALALPYNRPIAMPLAWHHNRHR